jgi:hypothetical protein
MLASPIIQAPAVTFLATSNEETTMLMKLKTALAIGLAVAATATSAMAFELQAGGTVKLKPTKAQLGIISPDDGDCPGLAKVTAWIFTNKPGKIDFMLVRQSGGVLGPYSVQTVAGPGGNIGSLNTGFAIDAPTDTAYRIVIAGTNVTSNWVPLTACL